LGLTLIGSALIATGAILAGCSPDTSAPTLARRATSTPVAGAVTPTGATLAPAVLTVEPFTDYACLNCHTDQEQLTALAVVEETGESLSSGPG